LQEYELVVVGDEPAGLWLLRRYSEAMAEHGGPGAMGWLSLESDHRPHSIPSLLGSAFDLQMSESWNLEIVSPQRNLIWHPENIRKMFPSLPEPVVPVSAMEKKTGPEELLTWDKPWLTEVRKALQRHPELYSLSQAVWKWMGRSLPTVSEAQFLNAYRFADFAYWDPSNMVPKDVSRVSLSLGLHPIEECTPNKTGGMTISFRGFGPISAKRWIWNLPWNQLTALCRHSPQALKLQNLSTGQACADQSLYGLRITASAEACPAPMRPVTVYLDDWHIPDPQSEMWPVQLFSFGQTKELCIWSSACTDTALEATQSSFVEATKRLYRLLPFLPTMARNFSVGLDSSCSFEEQTRAAWIENLHANRIELYQQTLSGVGARHWAFHLLVPAVDCHLPYPFGTLLAARKLVREFVPKKKRPTANASPTAQAPAHLP